MQTPLSLEELTEVALVNEIELYERKLQAIAKPYSKAGEGMARVYQILVAYRRSLLRALRDGHPEDWREYAVHAA